MEVGQRQNIKGGSGGKGETALGGESCAHVFPRDGGTGLHDPHRAAMCRHSVRIEDAVILHIHCHFVLRVGGSLGVGRLRSTHTDVATLEFEVSAARREPRDRKGVYGKGDGGPNASALHSRRRSCQQQQESRDSASQKLVEV